MSLSLLDLELSALIEELIALGIEREVFDLTEERFRFRKPNGEVFACEGTRESYSVRILDSAGDVQVNKMIPRLDDEAAVANRVLSLFERFKNS